jgi:hypothetical protein
MTLPTTDTVSTYPNGATTSTGTVLHVELLPDGTWSLFGDTTIRDAYQACIFRRSLDILEKCA